MKTLILIISVIIMEQSIMAQSLGSISSASTSPGWTRGDIFQDKVFIENKGQFDGRDKQPSSQIRYGIVSMGMGQQIYFTPTGLTYRYDKSEFPKEREEREEKFASQADEEKYEKEKMKSIINHVYAVNMQWIDANKEALLMAEEMVPEYYTYGDEKKAYKASAFKKLTYKNLYPNIDVEYIFHEKEGIKYSLILHPGADVSKIKMKYSGADKVYKDNNGNIHLVTPLGDIIDHAPFTFYASDQSAIASTFFVNNNIVSFYLKEYDNKTTVVIDPWTVGVTMQTTNKALEVERDAAGNIYVLGGTNGNSQALPLLLKKYSPIGGLIWTYTPSNTGGSFDGEYGNDLKVDKAGNIYIVAGSFFGKMYKVNPAGSTLWSRTTLVYPNHNGVASSILEPFRISIDCNNSNLICTGGGTDENVALFLNPSTGVTSNAFIYIFKSNISGNDLRDWVIAPNGNYYGMTIGFTPNLPGGCVVAFSPTMTQLWYTNHGYPFVYWSSSYTGHWATQPASLHLIAVSKNFIYTTSGSVLDKRNLATGAIITSVPIPGGVFASNSNGNSGIILDTCQNVYVSSQNGVYKYDSNLNFIASAATTAAVYDICLGINNEILACGNGFLASLNLSACIPAPLAITATATPTGNCNNGNIGTATATTTGGDPSYSYYWIPGGQTTSSVSGLAAGTYSVIVTDRDCNQDTAVVTVTASGALVTSVTQTNMQCNGANNGSATVSASSGTSPYTYSWSTGNTSATVTGLAAGTYTVTVTDANGCISVVPVNILQPPMMTLGITTIGTTCNYTNGNVTINAAGPSGPYTYLVSVGKR